jgi:TP901 family phage tail tape measure protein
MAANSTARVTVKLLDQLSAPANIVRGALRGIRGDMAALSGARLGLDKQIANAASRVRELRSALISIGATGAIAGYAIAKTMKPATNFETTMVDIRQKADMTKAAVAALGEQIKTLAPQVNKSSGDIAKGVDFLLGMGLDPKQAMDIMPAIGKTATAYRAEVEDLAKSSFAVMDNMKVKGSEMRKTLDVMAQAGKEGGFELKDMAREFPSLTAAAEALGIRGVSGVAKLAAALQIARKGAADGSEAATNTANLMQKIVSPETTKKFKKAGIDIRKELEKTQKAGGDPLLMVAQLTKKATKGNMAKLGDFFEDAQVQKFLRPFIEKMDEYKRIRDKAEGAEGTVDADYKLRMESFQATVDKVMNAFNTLAISVGDSLIPILTALGEKLAPLLTGAAEWVAANSQLAGGALAAAGALFALAGVVAVVRLGAALLSLGGLKSLRGVLDYLAPKGGPKVAAPATTPRVGPSGPAVASPGTTATVPRAMTAAEIATAAKGVSGLPGGASSVMGLVNRLKGGLVGAAVQIVGETVIDGVLDALPKPQYPAGYDPKAELAKSTLQRATELAKRITGSTDATPKAKPIDPGEYERSRRAQDEMRRDPEGSRGRAMSQVHGQSVVSDANVGADSRSTGSAAGQEVGQGIKDGLTASAPGVEAAAAAILARVKAMFAAGIDFPVRPKLEGAGAALRGIHSDTGIN